MKLGDYMEEIFYDEKDSVEALVTPIFLVLYDKTKSNEKYNSLWGVEMDSEKEMGWLMTNLTKDGWGQEVNVYNDKMIDSLFTSTDETGLYRMTSTQIKDFILESSKKIEFPWKDYLTELGKKLKTESE